MNMRLNSKILEGLNIDKEKLSELKMNKLKLYHIGGPNSTGIHQSRWRDVNDLMVQVLMKEQKFCCATSSFVWVKNEMYILLNVQGCNDWMYKDSIEVKEIMKSLNNDIFPEEVEIIEKYKIPHCDSNEGKWFIIALNCYSSHNSKIKKFKDLIKDVVDLF